MSLFPNYQRDSLTFVKGRGSYLYDQSGKKYLDFGSGIGVTNLGHAHPKLVQSLQQQAASLWHTSNLFTQPAQEEVANLLTQASQLDAVFFCNSGAEANEAAFKLARKWGHEVKGVTEPEVITFSRSFHGRTIATLTATGQEKVKKGFSPLPAGFVIAPELSLYAVEKVQSPQTVAVCLELVQGEGGVYPVPATFIGQLVAWCQANQILLIIDEVQTGMGRTGEWFAFQHYGVKPDIITLAKGMGNGFPIGAMLATSELKDLFSPGSHGTTFGGNPLAMAVAKGVCELLQEPSFLEQVKKKGQMLLAHLAQSLHPLQIVREVRGLGFMIGIELSHPATDAISALRCKGLIALPAGDRVIRLLPPLIVTIDELKKAVDLIYQTLSVEEEMGENDAKLEISE
ncbi:acetylornithine aminotransferase apoenzyme [Seinonella peptonophila]|uniref:Acetylornithine aminotransferase n=1 Tax=Seinonella peptonophila TaxID=112248 RepID=A0A1M4XR38_9BACL|nr:acetylornithine transaminase [Seinonella peptonophila]SHE95733.1 acetylornithine aminotransferase apoenzyme [Seinonella peptonophila]